MTRMTVSTISGYGHARLPYVDMIPPATIHLCRVILWYIESNRLNGAEWEHAAQALRVLGQKLDYRWRLDHRMNAVQ